MIRINLESLAENEDVVVVIPSEPHSGHAERSGSPLMSYPQSLQSFSESLTIE